MRSMTGFGRATGPAARGTVTVQVRSVNRKSLDVAVKLPEAWNGLESRIGEAVREVASRGTIHVEVAMAAADGGDGAWDQEATAVTLERLRLLAEREGLTFAPDAQLLWQIVTAQRDGAGIPPVEAVEEAVLDVAREALRTFAAMRAREGEALLIDFLTRLDGVRRQVAAIAERAPLVAPAYRETLFRRLREAGLELDLDDERVLKEIALFADRCDITEELTRLRSHLHQLEGLLKAEGEIGRKAEFILQEIGREIHTVGSKANDLAIAKHVIELKNELERVREQMANVE